MPRTYRVRPNPVASFFGGVVGIGMLIFGLRHFQFGEGTGFMLLWTTVLVGIVLFSFYNAFSKRGLPTSIVETTPDEGRQDAPLPDAAARLRQLDDLQRQGLISASEHEQRRADILRQL